MAVVPYSGSQQPGSPGGQPMPSEENLLMAAAIMHQQGRFQPQGQQLAGDVVRMPGASTPQDRVFEKLKTDDLNKLTTNRALMRALGGGAKVLPIKPEDK